MLRSLISSEPSFFRRLLSFVLATSFLLSPVLASVARAEDPKSPVGESSGDLAEVPPTPNCESAVSDAATAELARLKGIEESAKACVEAGVCEKGAPATTPKFKLFRFMRGLVVQSGIEIWESVKAIRGKELRSRPTALLDFMKNMAIIWPGQIFGWMKEQAKANIAPTFANAPYPIFGHTAFMVWTQSERGAQKTPEADDNSAALRSREILRRMNLALDTSAEPVANWMRPVLNATFGGYTMIRDAYKGKNGFWKENGARLVGFLSIIPLEIMSLTVMESLKATPHLIRTGSMPAGFAGILENRAVFAVLFGVYLSLKWSLFSKVFDLRVLPAFRGWLSSGWAPQWRSIKEKYGMRFQSGQVFDELKLGRLMTTDLYRAIRGRQFPARIEQCKLVAQTSMGEDGDGRGWGEYCDRWSAYMQFTQSGEFFKQLKERPAAWMKHVLGFPIEMTYRYGNSFLDGALVFWLLNSAIPAMIK